MVYITFSTDSGGTVFLEAEDGPGARPVSALGETASQAVSALEASLASIRSMSSTLFTNLRNGLPERPQEIELTFGIKASAELSTLIVAKAAGEANFTVKLKWV